jgi:hypothetical protein
MALRIKLSSPVNKARKFQIKITPLIAELLFLAPYLHFYLFKV